MKFIIASILMCAGILCNAQSEIQVNSSVHFDYYTDDNGTYDKIIFRLTVVNNSSKPIPDLGVTNRSEHVNFYINGKQNNPLSLYNGLEAIKGEKTIAPGETATWDNAWVLVEDNGIEAAYGNTFTIQWEYMGIKSVVIKVLLDKKIYVYLDD